jgi:hypothetical protein
VKGSTSLSFPRLSQAISHGFRLSSRVSEQPGRLDQQHHGRDQIEHGQLDLGKELNSRGAHEAHDQRADERPLQAAEAPDDDDDEGEYERVEAVASENSDSCVSMV